MNLSRLLIPILIFPFLMRAAEVAPQPVDVAELVRQAVATNPERQAYDAALAAERETASAAGSNQNPVLSLEVGRKRFRDAGGVCADEGQVWTATLSQTFEWPERVRLRRAIADRQVEAAKLGLGRFEQAIEAKATVLAYRLSRAQLRAQACEEVAERYAGLRKALVGRDPSGPAPIIELRSVEAAEVVARRRSEEARLALQQALLEMNQLRGAPSMAPLVVKAPSLALRDAPKLEELLLAAPQGNFGYRMQVLESEQLSLQSDLARRPPLSVPVLKGVAKPRPRSRPPGEMSSATSVRPGSLTLLSSTSSACTGMTRRCGSPRLPAWLNPTSGPARCHCSSSWTPRPVISRLWTRHCCSKSRPSRRASACAN
jgi:hypothetical protein